VKAAVREIADDLPALFKDICVGGLCFAAEALIDALTRDSSILTADWDRIVLAASSLCLFQARGPSLRGM
jgi:hypothetical protein